ncbi:Ral GTPase-activating protein subunit alpha-1 [Apophysomyces ossiformis]|uniref:Ral GTPase-activating protein subunit alpha-1 n=1 Tax=Apophysomyces ossiformis TaxID=679940 RepID=A0A8H7BMD2_9FUNG|nr:Ral GTPase-activating protein subunit alpha-1 [Apophysomyces ossiformis]
MRKASSVMKKTFTPGTSAGKPSNSTSTSSTADTPQDDSLEQSEAVENDKLGTLSTFAKKHDAIRMAQSQSSIAESGGGTIGIDIPILPSSSTFILAGKDDKTERLKKKAKNFLDERQKIKLRKLNVRTEYHSVLKLILSTEKSERPQSWNSKELIFLYVPELMRNGWQRKNIAKILAHILDHGNHLKLRALGFHLLLLWLNDQAVEYPECINLFANAIPLDLFVLDDINSSVPSNTYPVNESSGSQEEKDSSNHKLPGGGLQFVKKLGDRHPEKAFGQGLARDQRIKTTSLKLHQTLILGDDQPPLFPNPVQPTFHDSLTLIHIFIANLVRLAHVAAGSPPPPDEYEYPPGDQFERDDGIATGVGIDAAGLSAKFLFKIFRTYYLTKFVPKIAMELSMEGVPKDMEAFGFPACPPSILRTLLRFLIGYCLDNNYDPNTQLQQLPTASVSQFATPILKSIVLSSHETREMLHEILRQCMVLPCTSPQYRDITRGAIHILGVWMLGNEEERPSFLRRTGSASVGTIGQTSMTRSSSLASVATSKNSINEAKVDSSKTLSTSPTSSLAPTSRLDKHDHEYADANSFLRRYFVMIKLVFDAHGGQATATGEDRDGFVAWTQQTTDWEGLASIYKDAINVYRAITVTRGGIDMEWESWELLLRCLLDIQDWFMNGPEKYSRIPVQHLADDVADYICEDWQTLLHAFVRARIAHMEMWQDLKRYMLASMRWTQTLSQWVKTMHKLTKLLSSRLYKVEYDSNPGSERHSLPHEDGHIIQNRHSMHFGNPTSASRGRNKVRTRHLSIQGDHPRAFCNRAAGRPLSSGGSEGQLTQLPIQEDSIDLLQDHFPAPETSLSTVLRNSSSVSLSEKPNYAKALNRRSAHLTATEIPHIEEPTTEDEKDTSGTAGGSTARGGANIKFGIKNIIPTTSFSTSNAPSQSNSGNSHISAGGSVGSSLSKRGTRRTMSIHQFDTLWQDSSKLLNFVHHSSSGNEKNTDSSGLQPSNVKTVAKDEDDAGNSKKGKPVDWDRKSSNSSTERQPAEENLTISSKSNRTSASTILGPGETITMASSTAVNEKLPSSLGTFRSSEFLNLHNLPWDGQRVLLTWKNMICVIGNPNHIEGPQNYAVAVNCVVDILDNLVWIRAHQPYRNIPIPALYEFTPWLFQATELPKSYNIGRAAAIGCLCRLIGRKPEETVPISYYAHFYKAVLKGLASDDNVIVQAIVKNSERIFSVPLPGVYILIPPFIDAIEKQLLDDTVAREVASNVRKSCITILGSLISMSNRLSSVEISVEEYNMEWIRGFDGKKFCFADVKIWLKNLLVRLVNAETPSVKTEEDAETHCMLLGALCSLILDELLACQESQRDIVHECLLLLLDHLYWCSIPVIIVQEVLTRVIDALFVHMKSYERNSKAGRGLFLFKENEMQLNCLLEWLMIIKPEVLSDTELCQLVFDVIEFAIHVSSEGGEKILPHTPVERSSHVKKKEQPFKFKLLAEKRPALHNEHVDMMIGSDDDQGYVKESAEAVLYHLLHHFNNFPPPYGPATIQSTIVGPGVATEEKSDIEYHQYQYFSFNDTTIIAFIELPQTETQGSQSRIIIRDLTGRYAWDAHLARRYPPIASSSKDTETNEGHTERIASTEQGFVLREDISIREGNPDISTPQAQCASEPSSDALGNLLQRIGQANPDCILNSSLPLNAPSPPTELQDSMMGCMNEHLNEFLRNEALNNEQQESDVRLWYSKMNILRRKEAKMQLSDHTETMHTHLMANFSLKKDFLPAFPHELENPHVPFQQSRLLLSHLGFINYDHLKDGSFQMLNKTPALYRDLRGLDRKHGREIMKIAIIYVGPGQESEQAILHNSHGSVMYNTFVNSLGWEIDIATHTGYLGGLERNLTNGTRANYYCSSTLEMIFHDVTKMPTDKEDPKQLKKKRHVGNDHVHIVWNEHDRDYRIGTIGGDFGNAQIVVTPLANDLFAIQIHRDPKIPYFGPLFNRMIVSGAILGPLVRATAVGAFRASVHTNLYSLYKCVYAQRANDVRTIANRHKAAAWSYEQFMGKIFMPEE